MPNPENIVKHKFKKGQSGNPKGRPLIIPPLKDAIAKVLNEEKEGVSALEAILKGVRIKAIQGDTAAVKILLERAYGLPKQTIDMTVETKTPTIKVITTDGENFIKRQYERLDSTDRDGVRE